MVNIELTKQMDDAVKNQDWVLVTKLAKELTKTQKDIEDTKRKEREGALAKLTAKVKKQIDEVVNSLTDDEVKDIDGIWYINDYGEALSTCRLIKTTPKVRKPGATENHYPVTTEALLQRFGSQPYKGMTFDIAHIAAAKDGNKRYTIRKALIKLDQAK